MMIDSGLLKADGAKEKHICFISSSCVHREICGCFLF